MLMNPVKILLTFAFFYAQISNKTQNEFFGVSEQLNFTNGEDNLETVTVDIFYEHDMVNYPFLVHVICSALCFYAGRIACKVLMQDF